jgi:hypothetical protein
MMVSLLWAPEKEQFRAEYSHAATESAKQLVPQKSVPSPQLVIKPEPKGHLNQAETPSQGSLGTVAKPHASIEQPIVFLNCELQPLPIRHPLNRPFYVLDTMELNGLVEFLGSNKVGEGSWPPTYSLGECVDRCDLTNYGDEPLFAILMIFTISFRETIKGADGSWRGEPRFTASHQHRVEISKLDSHKEEGTFTFYAWNPTTQFVDVTPPSWAEAELAKSNDRIRVRLKQPGIYGPITQTLSPKQELAK